MSKKIIFKLQRSIETTEEVDQALIYNEDRTIIGQIDLTEDILALFPDEPVEGIGFPFKIFVQGTIDEKGVVDVKSVADYQDW